MLRKRTIMTPSVGAGGNDTNVLLLLHLDSSLTNSALGGSVVGNPVKSDTGGFDTTNYKFGSASFYSSQVIYFTGTSPENAIKTGMQSDFTFDYWAKISAGLYGSSDIHLLGDTTNQDKAVITIRHYDEPGYGLYIAIKSTVNGGSSYLINQNLLLANYATAGGWNHYACVRKDNILTLYVNGMYVNDWSFSPTIPSTQQHVSFGGYWDSSGLIWNYTFNNFDEIRFSNIARWTENFTPPTAPYA